MTQETLSTQEWTLSVHFRDRNRAYMPGTGAGGDAGAVGLGHER